MAKKSDDYIFTCLNRRGREEKPPCPVGSQPAPNNQVKIPKSRVPDIRKKPKCPECDCDSLHGPINPPRGGSGFPLKPILIGVVGLALLSGIVLGVMSLFGGGKPAITGLQRLYAFGEVAPGDSSTIKLRIKNDGEGELKISEFKFSDNLFSVGSKTLEVKPGESESVILTFTPTEEGEVNGTLTIISNDPKHGKVETKLKGVAQSTDLLRGLEEMMENSNVIKP